MSKALSTERFDYGELRQTDVRKCESAVERIGVKQRRIAADIVAIGKDLLEVKERLPHGEFGQWLRHYFGWTERSARRFMSAAEVFGKTDKLSDLTIDQSALYLLSSERCPDDLRENILKDAGDGTRITHSQVKQALSELNGHDGQDESSVADTSSDEVDELADAEEWDVADMFSDLFAVVRKWKKQTQDPGFIAQALRDLANQVEGKEVDDDDDAPRTKSM